MMKAKKSKEDGPKKVTVSRAPRGKKKSVTVVTGLSTFGTYSAHTHMLIKESLLKLYYFFQILILKWQLSSLEQSLLAVLL